MELAKEQNKKADWFTENSEFLQSVDEKLNAIVDNCGIEVGKKISDILFVKPVIKCVGGRCSPCEQRRKQRQLAAKMTERRVSRINPIFIPKTRLIKQNIKL